jgi:hypothetical protein
VRRKSPPRSRSKVLLGPRARAWRSRMMTKKFQQMDGSWDPALAERHAEMARDVLVRAFEDYLAQHLAVAGVETLDTAASRG